MYKDTLFQCTIFYIPERKMSFHSINPPESYFYEGRWTEDTVNVFIRVLMDDKKTGDWDVNGVNYHSLQAAHDFINVMMEKNFSWEEVLALINVLKKRYKAFKYVLGVDGVWWDRVINHVYAPDWEDIFKVNEFAKAFYHKGDLMYDNLKALFGSKYDIFKDVINISSDGPMFAESNNKLEPFIVLDSDNEEEVESLGFAGRKVPRKSLFINQENNSCRALVSLESNTTNPLKPTGKLKGNNSLFALNDQCLPPSNKSKGATITIKKESSSCASSSPSKVTYSPLGKK